MKLRTRTAALLAIPALTLGLAACSNDDATVVTSEEATSKVADAVSGDDTATTKVTDGGTTTTTAAPLGQDPAAVKVGDQDVQGGFSPVRCELKDNDRELEIEAGPDESTGQVDLEIHDPNGTPRLEGLDIDTANLHIEIDDEQAGAATVTRDGDTWIIDGQGTHDDSNLAEPVHVEVVCPV